MPEILILSLKAALSIIALISFKKNFKPISQLQHNNHNYEIQAVIIKTKNPSRPPGKFIDYYPNHVIGF